MVDRSIFCQAFVQLDSDMPKEGAPALVQKGSIGTGVWTVPLRETARSVKFENVVIEGVCRTREGGSDAEDPNVR